MKNKARVAKLRRIVDHPKAEPCAMSVIEPGSGVLESITITPYSDYEFSAGKIRIRGDGYDLDVRVGPLMLRTLCGMVRFANDKYEVQGGRE